MLIISISTISFPKFFTIFNRNHKLNDETKFITFYYIIYFALAFFRFLRKMKSKFQDFTDLKSRVCKNILCGRNITLVDKIFCEIKISNL